MKKQILAIMITILAIISCSDSSDSQNVQNELLDGKIVMEPTGLAFNGPVSSIVKNNNGHLFIGSALGNSANSYTGHALLLDKFTLETLDVGPVFEGGEVYSIVPDGDNGWFVAGDFNHADQQAVNRLVHILGDGSLDKAWETDVDVGFINDIILHNNVLYIIGQENDIVTANPQTGNQMKVIANNINFSTTVRHLLIQDNSLFIWSKNTGINGSAITTTDLLVLNLLTDEINSDFEVHVVGDLARMAVNSQYIALDGEFLSVNDVSVNGLVLLDHNGDLVTGHGFGSLEDLPGAQISAEYFHNTIMDDGIKYSIESNETGRVFHITSMDQDAQTQISDFQTSAFIRTLSANDRYLFIGGPFLNAHTEFSSVVKTDSSGNVIQYLPTETFVNTLAVDDSYVYVGGYCVSVFDQQGNPVEWPQTCENEIVGTIVTDNEHIYVGYGDKQSVDNKVQIYRKSDKALVEEIEGFNGAILDMFIYENRLYLGGSFTKIGDVNSENMAVIDLQNLNMLTWPVEFRVDNDVDTPRVLSLEHDDKHIYIGGYFDDVNGQARNGFAAVDFNGNLTAIQPLNGVVADMHYESEILYLCGTSSFETTSGNASHAIAALDTSTGDLFTLDRLGGDGTNCTSIMNTQNTIHVGGGFLEINAQGHGNLASFSFGR